MLNFSSADCESEAEMISISEEEKVFPLKKILLYSLHEEIFFFLFRKQLVESTSRLYDQEYQGTTK